MRFIGKLVKGAPAAILVGLGLGASPAAAQDQVSAVHAFPTFLVYTKTFLAMVEDINARGEGIVQINVRGGPEAIGMFEQPQAVRDGVVDMSHIPGSFYGAAVPEIDAMVAAYNRTPMDVRANGGAALMDEVHQKRMNVKHLGWIDGGIKFHIYMNQEPKFDENGVLDLTGVALRDNPIYHAFFEALQATTSSMAATDVYSALEKGVVDSAAWTSIGLMDLKWDEFLTHRVDPSFYNTDIGIIFNLDAWNALSPESRELLQEVVIEWEAKSYADRQIDRVNDANELQRRGMKFIEHTPAGAEMFQSMADEAAWGRMQRRMTEMGGDELFEQFRAAYVGE